MSNLIKSLRKIEYCNAAELDSAIIVKGRGIAESEHINFIELCIEPFASMQVNSDFDNNNEIFETVVTAKAHSRLPDRAVKLAFRVTAVSGERYIVGSTGTPYPLVKQTENFPENVADSQLNTVEITWKSPDRPFPVFS